MNRDKKSLLNFSTSLFYKIATIVVGIVLPKLFITSYGSAINGLQASVTQIFSYITLLEAGVGSATLQSLFKPVAERDHQKANAYLSATTKYYDKIGIIYFLILTALAAIYPLIVSVDDTSYLTVFAFILITGALNGINFFYLAKVKLLISAEGDGYIVSVLSMIIYLCSSACKIILILLGSNILIVQGAFLAINLFFTFCYYLVAKKKYPWLSFRETPDFSCVEQKNSVLLHKISGLIFQNVDVLLLTFLCDLKIVSIYTMYKLVVNMLTTIVATFGDSFHFVFGQTFNTEKAEKKPRFCSIIDCFNVYYSAIAFGLFAVMFLLILPFMRLYTEGMDINYIYPVLPYLYLTIELLTVGREAMMRTIEVAGHFKKTQWRAVTEAIINLVVSIIAVFICQHYFGAIGGLYGVLIGTVISMLYRTLDINLYANKKILNRSSLKSFKVFLTNGVLFVAVCFLAQNITINPGGYLSFFIYAAVTTICILPVFVLIQSLVNPAEAKTFFRYLWKKLPFKRARR